jgi:flagellar hook assembly protein FlgD
VVNATDNINDMEYTYDAVQENSGVSGETYAFEMKPASPNPFTETTSIAYTVPTQGGYVEITVYDVSGREIRRLLSGAMPGGHGVALWDGLDNNGQRVASGVYFARLDVDGLTAMGKLMVLK